MFRIERVTAEAWKEISEKAHVVVFGDYRAPEFDRVDYTLLVICKGELGGFITIKEMDSKTAYIQYGGVFPNFAKSTYVVKGYQKYIETLKADYKFIWTRIENTNLAMLKMALSQGFLVTGCSLVKNKLFLDLSMEVL